MSLAMTPTTAAAMGSVPVDKAGVGSAVLNSMRQVGGSLGIALMGAIVAASVSVRPTSPAYPDQFVEGYHNALHVAAAIAILGAVVAVATVRKVAPPEAGSAARARRRVADGDTPPGGGTEGCGARQRLRHLLRRGATAGRRPPRSRAWQA